MQYCMYCILPFSVSTLLVERHQGHPACKKLDIVFFGGDDLTIALLLVTTPPPSSFALINREWWHSGTGLTGLSWKVAVKRVMSCRHPYIYLLCSLWYCVQNGRSVR